jgi:hypothetical protein
MSPAGKAGHEHRLADSRKFDGPHRAAQDGLKAPSEFPAPMRAREDADERMVPRQLELSSIVGKLM